MSAKKPSIILLDIETSPITAYTWATFDTNVIKVLEPSKILSCSWKELNSDTIYVKTIADYPQYQPGKVEDLHLVTDVWKVLDEADIVIAHHGDAFDIKKLNARFVMHGLSAPSFYETVDTKKVASRYFKFDSNSLNSLGVYLNEGKKYENGGFDLWVRCIAGDKEAWEKMKDYNKQDVLLLERIYLRLRPFMDNHPNLNVITDSDKSDLACTTCLSTNLTKRGFSITRSSRKQRYQCGDCGSWSSGPYEKIRAVLN